ncbi:hypothetical protein ACOROC_05380 [Acinetobacter baumannii]|uniref:hypothetical protein n=1 Tax=Acinetobacter baumannii TaxID=470 RepID=UPI003A810F63
MLDLNKLRSEFEAQHSDKVFKIVKFDEATNAYCLHAHLPLTEINLSALAEINYGWDLWQKAKAQAVPEGYVVVPKVPTEKFKEDLKQHLDELWWGDHGCDWDGFVSVNGIDPLKIYALAIEASESGAEG